MEIGYGYDGIEGRIMPVENTWGLLEATEKEAICCGGRLTKATDAKE